MTDKPRSPPQPRWLSYEQSLWILFSLLAMSVAIINSGRFESWRGGEWASFGSRPAPVERFPLLSAHTFADGQDWFGITLDATRGRLISVPVGELGVGRTIANLRADCLAPAEEGTLLFVGAGFGGVLSQQNGRVIECYPLPRGKLVLMSPDAELLVMVDPTRRSLGRVEYSFYSWRGEIRSPTLLRSHFANEQATHWSHSDGEVLMAECHGDYSHLQTFRTSDAEPTAFIRVEGNVIAAAKISGKNRYLIAYDGGGLGLADDQGNAEQLTFDHFDQWIDQIYANELGVFVLDRNCIRKIDLEKRQTVWTCEVPRGLKTVAHFAITSGRLLVSSDQSIVELDANDGQSISRCYRSELERQR